MEKDFCKKNDESFNKMVNEVKKVRNISNEQYHNMTKSAYKSHLYR